MNDKCVVLNAKKMNFDGKLDFSMLSSDVTVYDDTTKEQLSERIQGADIIVTKEMPVSGEMIQHFPESVKLAALTPVFSAIRARCPSAVSIFSTTKLHSVRSTASIFHLM